MRCPILFTSRFTNSFIKIVLVMLFAMISAAVIVNSAQAQVMRPNCTKQVSMTFNAENWLDNTNALVSITINASVPANQVNTVTSMIKTQLSKISNTSAWRLINLNRKEGDSGLITLNATAMARLSEANLTQLQQQLTKLNQPGTKYSIATIDHQPDLTTINKATSALRNTLYQQISTGLAQLNQALPNQTNPYQVYRIEFIPAHPEQTIHPLVMYAGRTNTRNQQSGNSSNMAVSNKMQLSAHVTYAAVLDNCPMS